MTDKEQELKKKIEEKLRANIIREIKSKYPKGFCYVCGNKSVTIHHLREHIIRKTKRKGKCNGQIPLCRKCHDFVEGINVRVKLAKRIKEVELKGRAEREKEIIEIIDKFWSNEYYGDMSMVTKRRLIEQIKKENKE